MCIISVTYLDAYPRRFEVNPLAPTRLAWAISKPVFRGACDKEKVRVELGACKGEDNDNSDDQGCSE